MKKSKKKSKNNSNKLVYLLIVLVVFTLAFILLINKQNSDSYYLNVRDKNFNVKTEYGKTIVAKDMTTIYPKYYVVYVSSGKYSIYVYNYYDTDSQYELEFNRLLDKIVDYNAKDKMIRYIDSRGYGLYDDIYRDLPVLLGNDNIQIY